MDRGISMIGYSYKAENVGKHGRRRAFIFLLWCVCALLFAAVGWLIASPAALALAAVLEGAVIILTLPNLTLEYDYEIADGYFTVAEIYGKGRRRVVDTVDLRRIQYFSPATADAVKKAEAAGPAVRRNTLHKPDSECGAVMLYSDGKSRLAVLYFDADERFVKALRFYCPSALRG